MQKDWEDDEFESLMQKQADEPQFRFQQASLDELRAEICKEVPSGELHRVGGEGHAIGPNVTNFLLDGHADDLLKLVQKLAQITPVAGSLGQVGLLNPARPFNKLPQSVRDSMSDEEYREYMSQIAQLCTIWEGVNVVPGFALASNLLLQVLLESPSIKRVALSRAYKQLDELIELSERLGVSLK